ncbi:MAG: cytochrome c biogenesis protein CcdA [candidate division WOR-3 bacterium]
MKGIFVWLSGAIQSTPVFAYFASFLWGLLSILLSPCHLASIPLIVGFISGQEKLSTRRAFFLSLLFALGILITISTIGLITGMIGRVLGDIGPYGNYLVAIIFFLVGLYLLEIIPLPFFQNINHPNFKKKGLLASLILGLTFGLALGPCTFAYMAPMLAITLSITTTKFLYGLSLLITYGIGHCSIIILAGTFTEVIQHYLNWDAQSKGSALIKKICGILVILGGIYLIWTA